MTLYRSKTSDSKIFTFQVNEKGELIHPSDNNVLKYLEDFNKFYRPFFYDTDDGTTVTVNLLPNNVVQFTAGELVNTTGISVADYSCSLSQCLAYFGVGSFEKMSYKVIN